jgi:hypothetical protein
VTKTYSFAEQWERGKQGEDVLDAYFEKWYHIKKARLEEELKGKYDRWFKPKGIAGAKWIPVEYKTDELTDKTGNLFIETYSAVEWGRYGWAWTTKAEKVIYYALPDTVYILDVETLRTKLGDWHKEGRKERKVKNKGYTSMGYAIPADEIAEIIGEKNVRILP